MAGRAVSGAYVVTVGLVLALAAGCSASQATSAAPAAGSPSAQAVSPSSSPSAPLSAVQMTFEAEKAKYVAWVATFTPAQKAKLAELSPDKLATMTSEQMTTAFQIPASEVSDATGKIDPALYATSYAIRDYAAEYGTCSKAVLDQFGGPVQMTSQNMQDTAEKYANAMAAAVWPAGAVPVFTVGQMHRCDAVEGVRSLSAEARAAVPAYESVIYVDPSTVHVDSTPGTLNVSFAEKEADNLDKDAMVQWIGNVTSDVNTPNTWTIYAIGLHTTDAGLVLPTSNGAGTSCDHLEQGQVSRACPGTLK